MSELQNNYAQHQIYMHLCACSEEHPFTSEGHKKLPCGVMSPNSIFKHIVRNGHLHVMCVRKFSRVPVP